MRRPLSDAHEAKREEFRAFVALDVEPFAEQWDRDQRVPDAILSKLAERGYLGCRLPPEYSGQGWDVVTFGLLNEALGKGSSALTDVLTVQAMVSMALLKWGRAEQKRRWLPPLAKGEMIGAFALTEPGAGSAIQCLATEFTRSADGRSLILNGQKRWISCAQFAAVFLVFGTLEGRSAACVVPRDAPGLRVEPIHDLMGFRAAGLAEVHFEDVKVPSEALVGKPGFALSHVAPVGLHYGRLSTACSALGLLRGCFEESIAHASVRRIGQKIVGDLGMIRSLIARMGTDLEAAGLLCHSACRADDEHLPAAFEKALVAKYFTSRAAVRAASDAVQILGASGCHGSSPASRYYRDAKIMEIIEGTTQIHEDILGRIFVGQAGRLGKVTRADAFPDGGSPAQHRREADLAGIARFNRTETPFPDNVTVQELIETQVDKHSRETAIICDHDPLLGAASLTYAQLDEKVNQLAHRLRAEGVRPGHIVALLVERSFSMVTGILGILKAGGAYLPISPDNPPDRIAYMLRDGGVRILLVQSKTAGRVVFGGLTINLEDPDVYHGSRTAPSILNTPRDLAYVIYTSGSTGKPKGVMIEHRSLVNRLDWMQRAYPIDERDVILQKTPYSFDVSVWELFWWALAGAKLCFLVPGGERNPLAIVETIRKHHVSVLHFVPSMLNVFLEYLDGKTADVVAGVASLRQCFASGEALRPSHVRKFNDIIGSKTGARLTNLYGPTEATVDVSYFDCPTRDEFDVIPIGRPIQNIRLSIIRDSQEVAIGETGELCIAGVGLARGYLNNAALTDERFTDNPARPGERIYRTGDIARWLPDGNIEYLGREDHQVKIRGLRIELGEIESTIREHPGIADCVAVVKKYSENVILIVAYVVWISSVDVEGLKHYLKRHLPDYMIPHRFETLDALPVTSSGKADRNALPEPVIHVSPSWNADDS
jgi:D-alanine--poly(phosphoribitol) ligase subunit 1